MKAAMVSTYPPMQCGIGNYSRLLYQALAGLEGAPTLHVLTETGHRRDSNLDGSIQVHQVYSRRGEYGDALVEKARELDLQVLHFQYAPDLLGEDERLPNTLAALRRDGRRTVVTLHTVYGPRQERVLLGKHSTRWFHQHLAQHADCLLVHQEAMRQALLEQGVPDDRIAVIPHGTVMEDAVGRPEARANLGLDPDATLFLFFGFIHIQKNVHTVVRAFTDRAADMPGSKLLVAGRPFGGHWYNKRYLTWMKSLVATRELTDRVIFHDDFIPGPLASAYIKASDVMLLPHKQAYASASGVFHQAAGADKAVICAKGPKFQDGMRILAAHPNLLVEATDRDGWGQAMVDLASSADLRAQVAATMSDYGRATAWPVVARTTSDLYNRLVTAK
jgi:glycosyltransferase involved in cell wall biosynthesis